MDCNHVCDWVYPYGFVPEADCPVHDNQFWFWTEEWQAKEREVDEHIRKGEIETFDTIEEFLGSLR